MALSTRNRLPAQITEVVKGEATARASLQAGDWRMVEVGLARVAIEQRLEAGQQVTALIKATDVVIMTQGDLA